MAKLHLGCGQRYFEGYVNIDYPLSEHSVQQTTVADVQANLFELYYEPATIDEVRLHHVFEHFSRAQACSMLATWNFWLKEQGRVHIEVPDFEKTAKAVLKLFATEQEQAVGLRHIFGSQEAHWAVHYEGYTAKRLKNLLEVFGFKTIEIKQSRYLNTYNLEVVAQKVKKMNTQDCRTAARNYLSSFMVADVESEQLMLQTWMNDFEKHFARINPVNGKH